MPKMKTHRGAAKRVYINMIKASINVYIFSVDN